MNDLISREELKARFKLRINWLEKDVHDEYSRGLFHGAETDATLIDEIPAAKVERVAHGRWLSYLDGDHIMPEVYYQCSECGSRGWSRQRNYCPDCGAKMSRER